MLDEQHHAPGREQHEEPAQPELALREEQPAEQPGRDRAEQHPQPGGDLPLRPEATEEVVVEQRPRRDVGGRARRRRWWGSGDRGGHGLLLGQRGTHGRCEREVDADERAGVGRVEEADRAAVQVGHPACDRETQAGSASARTAEGAEPLEDALPVGRVDPGALVVHLEREPAVLLRRHEPDRAAGRAVPRRVVEQVGHELPEPGRVGVDDELGRLDQQGEVDVPADHPRLGDGLGQ